MRFPGDVSNLGLSIILFDKILHETETSTPAKALLTYQSRTIIRFANGPVIVALPCGREGSTLRGQTADMVILDEANFIPSMVIESVIRPTMITRPNVSPQVQDAEVPPPCRHARRSIVQPCLSSAAVGHPDRYNDNYCLLEKRPSPNFF